MIQLHIIDGWTFSGTCRFKNIDGTIATASMPEIYIPIANYAKAFNKFLEGHKGREITVLLAYPRMRQLNSLQDLDSGI